MVALAYMDRRNKCRWKVLLRSVPVVPVREAAGGRRPRRAAFERLEPAAPSAVSRRTKGEKGWISRSLLRSLRTDVLDATAAQAEPCNQQAKGTPMAKQTRCGQYPDAESSPQILRSQMRHLTE